MNENAHQALAALLKAARGHYGSGERFHLSPRQMVALVRGLLATRPGLTVAELRELVKQAGPRRGTIRTQRPEGCEARSACGDSAGSCRRARARSRSPMLHLRHSSCTVKCFIT
jgi:hypothetical protein